MVKEWGRCTIWAGSGLAVATKLHPAKAEVQDTAFEDILCIALNSAEAHINKLTNIYFQAAVQY